MRKTKIIEYPKYKKILFCTDFSENADYAFDYAYGVAKRDEGYLYILHVIPHNPNQDYAEGLVKKEILEKIRKTIEKDIDTKYREHYINKIEDGFKFEIVIKSGREDDEILDFAKQEKVDIIVMGTHGKTGIARVYFGSVAEKILRRSPYPVFTIPCKKKLEYSYGKI